MADGCAAVWGRDSPHTAVLFRRLFRAIRCWLRCAGGPLAVSIVAIVKSRIRCALLLAVVEDTLGDCRCADGLTVDLIDVEGEAKVVVGAA